MAWLAGLLGSWERSLTWDVALDGQPMVDCQELPLPRDEEALGGVAGTRCGSSPLASGKPRWVCHPLTAYKELETLNKSVGPCLEGWDLHGGSCPVMGAWVMQQPSARRGRAAALPCPRLHREETGANPTK